MPKSNESINKHITNFLAYCEVEKGLSPTTSKNYHNFLKMFLNWMADTNQTNLKPHDLTPELIWNYRLYLSRKKDSKGSYIKKTTQNYYLIALRNLLNYFSEKDIQSLPADKIKLPKLTDKDKAIKFLNFDQVESLFNMPDLSKPDGLRDRAIIEILFSTGMRVSELTSLNIRLFNIQNIINNKIYVGQAKNLKKRWQGHRDKTNNGDTRPLYNSMRKHGFDKFEMNMIEEFAKRNFAKIYSACK